MANPVQATITLPGLLTGQPTGSVLDAYSWAGAGGATVIGQKLVLSDPYGVPLLVPNSRLAVDGSGVTQPVTVSSGSLALSAPAQFDTVQLNNELSQPLQANATYTGTPLDMTGGGGYGFPAPGFGYVTGTAIADQPGTLYLEVSADAQNWRRIATQATAAVGSLQYATINDRCRGFAYAHFVYVNGITAQGQMNLTSALSIA